LDVSELNWRPNGFPKKRDHIQKHEHVYKIKKTYWLELVIRKCKDEECGHERTDSRKTKKYLGNHDWKIAGVKNYGMLGRKRVAVLFCSHCGEFKDSEVDK
jgi:hypothetical protein